MTTRRYDIDAIRVLAFGILILYHCGMLFVADWGWHIKSSYTIAGLDRLMQFVNAWRMPLLFLISGAAIALARPHRDFSQFMRTRSFRILFPLMMAMIFTIPLQAYVQAVANHSIAPGLLNFLVHYFTFQPWPAGAFDGSEVGFTWNHLWYLPYLFTYTTVMVAALKLASKVLNTTEASTSKRMQLEFALLVIALALTIIALKLYVKPYFPETHAFYNDGYAHPYYFSFFAMGYWLGRPNAQLIWQQLAQHRVTILILALISFIGLKLGFVPVVTHTLFSLLMIACILGIGYRYLNHPQSVAARYSRAIFPWYILHQTYIVLLAYWLVPMQLGVWLEAPAIVAGTFIACWVTYNYLLLPVPKLHAAFGIFIQPSKTNTNA